MFIKHRNPTSIEPTIIAFKLESSIGRNQQTTWELLCIGSPYNDWHQLLRHL